MAIALYVLRMHAITGWYHRYFAHRTFKTSRPYQLLWAVIGNSTFQRGPLWWAAHHRHHHRHSDAREDTHSPIQRGFWFSHIGWIFAPENFRSQLELVPDLARFPELMWIDRNDYVVPIACAGLCVGVGAALRQWLPGLGTGPWQLLVWYLISTIAVAHATFSINSFSHLFGSRPFQTTDTSRNNWLLALLTLGEGWHNNHHHYQSSARQGFRWWQIDITWYLLWLQCRLGLVSELKGVPERARATPPVAAPRSPSSPALSLKPSSVPIRATSAATVRRSTPEPVFSSLP